MTRRLIGASGMDDLREIAAKWMVVASDDEPTPQREALSGDELDAFAAVVTAIVKGFAPNRAPARRRPDVGLDGKQAGMINSKKI